MPLSWMMLRKQGALTKVETWLLFAPPIKIPGYVPVLYYGAVKKTLKLNRFLAKVWAPRHKICITAISTHLVLELCNNKNLLYWFKAKLTLETRIGYICNIHGYQRGICDGLEMKLT